tara:strand:- start:62 stop:640 length:579 start_codon:yes stop_codon:yes gene_type:complete
LKIHKDLVLSFAFEDSKFEFYKLKTIRGTNIFFDNEKNFYASWDDLWHVLNHISSDENYHWTLIQPEFIAKDYRRLILGYLNKHKTKVGPENYGEFYKYWSNWETILFEDGSTVELDISCLSNKIIKVISLDYNQLIVTSSLKEVLVKFFSPENSDYYIVNLSSGKKIAINSSNKLSEQDVLPGDLLKLYNV